MSITVNSPADLAAEIGQKVVGEWFTIDQERISAFADATEDWQWIHLDAERATAGPFGATIAHGYLTLSLLPRLTRGHIVVGSTAMVVNYGHDRVRFLQPVVAGSRVRAITELRAVEQSRQGLRVRSTVTIEIDGSARPALVAEPIALLVPDA